MRYDVEPSAVAGRDRQVGVRAVIVGAGAVVILGLAGALVAPRAVPLPREAAAEADAARLPAGSPASSDGDATTGSGGGPSRSSPGRPLPGDVACHDLDRATCLRVARAALRALPEDAPTVASVATWSSLLCGDSSDCPPGFLDDAEPLGSAVLWFVDDSPTAAVNVVDWNYAPNIRLGPRAWLVGWALVSAAR